MSVWCRVVCQHEGQGVRVLAMLCPLFMIRSYLPVPAKVLIDTPGLKVHLEVLFFYIHFCASTISNAKCRGNSNVHYS